MSFATKSAENMEIAVHCRDTGQCLDVGVSRAYYSAFQHAKQYLLNHGVTEGNYTTKAGQWKVLLGSDTKPFAHSSIWKMVKGYLNVSKPGNGLKIARNGEFLHEVRKQADYGEMGLSPDTLVSCIKMVEGIKSALTGV